LNLERAHRGVSDIEPEVHDITFLHRVFLSFRTHLTFLLGGIFGAKFNKSFK
jgi:hypothetical protein